MPLPLPGVLRIAIEFFRIGLKDFAFREKQQAHLIGRHARDEGICLVEGLPQPLHRQGRIHRRIAGYTPEISELSRSRWSARSRRIADCRLESGTAKASICSA